MAPVVLGLGAAESSGVPTNMSVGFASKDDRGFAIVTEATAGVYASFFGGEERESLYIGDVDAANWDMTSIMRFPLALPKDTIVVSGSIWVELSGVPAGLDYDILTLGQVEGDSARISTAEDATTWVAGASPVGSYHFKSSEHSPRWFVELPISGAHLTSVLGHPNWISGNYVQFALRKSPQVRPSSFIGAITVFSTTDNPISLSLTYLA